MMLFGHPRDAKLRRWLDAEEPAKRVDAHVARCERCSDRLLELGQPAPTLGAFLSEMLAPDVGLSDRLEGNIAAAVGTRSLLAWALDLYGAGLDTVRLLVEEDDG